ncbi:MAG: bacteriohemerythrin [Negativicutes bacterium]|nr:bacteriohemerythrin [Negativicutes bacterium]
MLQGWKDMYSVNVPTMDTDHQKMVGMIGTLYNAMKKGQSRDVLSGLISELNNYAVTHFSREETYLKNMNHYEFDNQYQQHKLFLAKVSEFRENYEAGNNALAIQMLPFLNEWFLNHIMKMDMKYKG